MGCGKCFRSCILFNHSFILSLCVLREMSGPPGKKSPRTHSLVSVSVVSLGMLIGRIVACTICPNKNHEGFWNILSCASKGTQGSVRLLFLWLWWSGGVVEQQGCVEPWVTWLKTQCCPRQVRIERKDREKVFPLPTSFCGTGVVAGPWTCLTGALPPTLTSQPQN